MFGAFLLYVCPFWDILWLPNLDYFPQPQQHKAGKSPPPDGVVSKKDVVLLGDFPHKKHTETWWNIYMIYIYIFITIYIYIHNIYMYIYYIYVHILYHIYILYTCICILCIYIYIHIIIILYIWLIIYDRYLELNGLREVVELNSVNCGNSMRSE